MHAATAAVLAVTAIANLAIAAADLTRARFVLANSAAVHVPVAWLPRLAVLKVAGSAGLLLWFVDVPVLPALAAAGLVCFFTGAVTAHIRAGVLHNIAFPGAYLGLAIAALALLLGAPQT